MIRLSVIVVTWNCRKYLQEFFESFGDLLNDPSVEIIVVDNASADDTCELIAAAFPMVHLVRGETNLGFARGNNLGLARAVGEWICLINPDVKLLPGCLERMIEFMREHRDIGLLGPRMFEGDGVVHRSTMRFPTVWNYFCAALALDALFPRSRLFRGFLTRDFGHDETREVEVLNGWFWMTRRSALERVGLLDDTFFMYGEDIDWCQRFCDAGLKRVYFAGASAIHYGGGSSSNAPARFYVEQQRALLHYFKKHHNLLEQGAFVASMWLYHVVRIIGHGAKYLLADSNRRSAAVKIEHSLACLRWLFGSGTPALKEVR